MKVLHVSLKPIYPKVDGGCVAIDNFLNLLTQSFDEVDHVCIATPKHAFDSKVYADLLPEKAQFKANFFVDTSIKLLPLLKSFFSREAYQLKRFYSADLATFLEQNANNYDALIFESIFALPSAIRLKTKAKIYCRTHNVEHNIWQTKSRSTSNWLKKRIFQKFSEQLKFSEQTYYRQLDGLIHISSSDERVFVEMLPEIKQITIPLSVSEIDFVAPNFENKSLLRFGFIGSGSWKPNSDAIQELIQRIFPQITAKWCDAKMVVAGYETEQFAHENSMITFQGKVNEVREFYDLMTVFLAPLKSGSGLKIKIVEAICQGKIVIGSSLAFEGLDFLPHKRIANINEEYLKQITEILADSTIREQVLSQQKEIRVNFERNNLISKLKDFVN